MDDEAPAPERPPRPQHGRLTVAGVAGGVGTTTVARALGAVDRGVFTGRVVDVLVCRATGESLIRAARAAQLIVGQAAARPVLAVSAVDGAAPSRPAAARLRLLEPHTTTVVVLPYVRRWRDLATPLDDLTGLLTLPAAELPRPLRRFAAAIQAVHGALRPGDPPAAGRPRRHVSPDRHRPAVRTVPSPRRTP
jgi:hypothetical protein